MQRQRWGEYRAELHPHIQHSGGHHLKGPDTHLMIDFQPLIPLLVFTLRGSHFPLSVRNLRRHSAFVTRRRRRPSNRSPLILPIDEIEVLNILLFKRFQNAHTGKSGGAAGNGGLVLIGCGLSEQSRQCRFAYWAYITGSLRLIPYQHYFG